MDIRNYISTDCVCDLPKEYLEENNIGVIRFYLYMDSGRFMDGYEITVSNVIDHYEENETKIVSRPPTPNEYAKLFGKQLKIYDNIIHFTISSDTSDSYKQAAEGIKLLGEDAKRVHIVDTKTLSSGMGFIIINAVKMNKQGYSAEEIVAASEKMIPKVDVSFVTKNADYLAINDRVSPVIAKFFKTLKLRPVFAMKDGKLTVARFEYGNGYVKRYIKQKIKKTDRIDLERVFITNAACSKAELEKISKEVTDICPFKKVIFCTTSATVACNCGAGSFGIIFMYK